MIFLENSKNFSVKLNTAKSMMNNFPDIATSMIILTESGIPNISPIAAPIIIVFSNSPLVHYRCAMADKFITSTWSQMSESEHSSDCSLQGSDLIVGYNNATPFFQLSSSETLSAPHTFVSGTLEGELLRSFILQHNLNVSFKNANFNVGSVNKTSGIWSGVVGMVCI